MERTNGEWLWHQAVYGNSFVVRKEWQTPGFDTDSEETTKMQALQDGRAITGGEKDYQTRSSEIVQLTPPVKELFIKWFQSKWNA